jgi:hypothetical protein
MLASALSEMASSCSPCAMALDLSRTPRGLRERVPPVHFSSKRPASSWVMRQGCVFSKGSQRCLQPSSSIISPAPWPQRAAKPSLSPSPWRQCFTLTFEAWPPIHALPSFGPAGIIRVCATSHAAQLVTCCQGQEAMLGDEVINAYTREAVASRCALWSVSGADDARRRL